MEDVVNRAEPNSDYLTLKQFLVGCPLSESTVRRWIRSGKLASIQPGGKNTSILVRSDALSRIEDTEGRADEPSPSSRNSPTPRRQPNWRRG
jgi:hypothetical protein